MRTMYILILVAIVALTLGCVSNKQDGTSTRTQIQPVQTSQGVTLPTIASQGAAPAPTNGDDLYGTEGDIAAMDSMLNDSSLDTTLSSSI
jgi:hypothetical protein